MKETKTKEALALPEYSGIAIIEDKIIYLGKVVRFSNNQPMLKPVDIESGVLHRFPEALALIVSKDQSQKINLCPIGYFTLIAWEPKTWVIGLYEKHYSTKIISETKEFVLCLPSVEQAKDLLYCGSISGRKVDKTKSISLKFTPSSTVKPPLVEDSIACFECKVVQQRVIGDHVAFFGQIVMAYESGKNWRQKLYNWDNKKIGTIALGDKFNEISFSPEGAIE